MIHLFVDGDYFLTGVTPSTEATVRECVEQMHDAISTQLFRGTSPPAAIEQRVVFFSSAILKSLEEQEQREVLIATLRRLRFQTIVLDTIAGRAGSPVDSAICTKTMSILAKTTSVSNNFNSSSGISSSNMKPTTLIYFSSNAYIASALEWSQGVGCGVCFIVYNGDSVADELLAYVSSTYGGGGGIATIPKGKGVNFLSTTEAASAILAALQYEGKELPLSVLLQLKQLQQRLTDSDKRTTSGLNQRKEKNPSVAPTGSEVDSSLGGDDAPPLFTGHTHVPPPITGVPNPFATDECGEHAKQKHGNSETSNSITADFVQMKFDGDTKNGTDTQTVTAPALTKNEENELDRIAEERGPKADKKEQQRQHGGGGGGGGIITPDAITTHTTSTTTTTTPVPPMTQYENTLFDGFPEPEVSTRLPSGWALMYDRQRRRHYFVYTDTTTNAVRTTWTHPNGVADQVDLEQQVDNWYRRQLDRRQTTAVTPAPTPGIIAENSTAAGWEERIDPASGRKYYMNRQSKVTSWTLPPANPTSPPIVNPPVSVNAAVVGTTTGAMPAAPISPSPTPTVAAVNSLPPFWEECVDPESGRKFYVNHQTRVTTWARPPSLPLQHQQQPIQLQQQSTRLQLQQQQQQQQQQYPVGPVAPLRGGASVPNVSALPPFWEERVDPNTGRKLYVNHQTRETTWTRP